MYLTIVKDYDGIILFKYVTCELLFYMFEAYLIRICKSNYYCVHICMILMSKTLKPCTEFITQ